MLYRSQFIFGNLITLEVYVFPVNCSRKVIPASTFPAYKIVTRFAFMLTKYEIDALEMLPTCLRYEACNPTVMLGVRIVCTYLLGNHIHLFR